MCAHKDKQQACLLYGKAKKPAFPLVVPTKDRKKRKVKKEEKEKDQAGRGMSYWIKTNTSICTVYLYQLDSAGTDRLFWSGKAVKDVETVFPGCDDPLMRDMWF